MKYRLKTVIKTFLEWAEASLASNTVIAYRHQLNKFLTATGNKAVERLRSTDLTRRPKTWHEYQAVSRCFKWAVEEAKLFRTNPFKTVKLPAMGERKRIMLPGEMMRFLRACSPRCRQFLLALRETFARPQEIRAARWDDLVSEQLDLPIEEALVQGKALIVLDEYKDRARRKDASRPRVLLVSPRLGRLLLRLLAQRVASSEHIFLNTLGHRWSNNAVRCLLRRLRRRFSIEPDKRGDTIVAYTFRHSQATLACSKGITDRLLADILGHTDPRTTAKYQHLQVGHLREAIGRLAAERSKARENRKRSA